MDKSADIASNRQFGIAVVGGGLAGTSMGLALRNHFGRVAVIDANPQTPIELNRASDADARNIARNIVLASSSARIFESLGVWEEIKNQATPIRTIYVSEKGRFGVTSIRSEEEGLTALGWTVAYSALYESLRKALSRAGGVTLMPSTRVEAIRQKNDQVFMEVLRQSAPETISADLVILADGGGTLLNQAGFELKVRDYQQTAIAVNMETEIARPNVAYERFTRYGPLAVLPTGDKRYGVVWVRPSARARAMANWDEPHLIDELQADLGRRLGSIRKLASRPACYPLCLKYVQNMVKERVIALGNAAHTLHPVAGQGFNLTLRDVASLAEHLFANESLADGIWPPNDRLGDRLNDWHEQRIGDIQRVVGLTDLMARAFAWPFVSPLRSMALVGLDLCPSLRRAIVRRSLGLSPPLSRLASGLPIAAP